jgi:hypothetical protein
VKVLGVGDSPKGVTIHAHAFSKSALDKLAAAGCTVQRLSWPDNAPVEDAEPDTAPKRAGRGRSRATAADEGEPAAEEHQAAEGGDVTEPAETAASDESESES